MLGTIRYSWKTTTDNTKERRRFSLRIVNLTATKEKGKRKRAIVKIEPGTEILETVSFELQQKIKKVKVKLEQID